MYSQDLLKVMGTRLATEFLKERTCNEERLWKSVIATAFEDCLNLSGTKNETYRKQDAHKWFIDGDSDFQNVCYMAGLDPLLVRNRYLTLYEEEVIIFTPVQKEWGKYRESYKVYRGDTTKEQRALIRKNIERIKCRIIKFKPKKKNVRQR
jgi:hypothetical protein